MALSENRGYPQMAILGNIKKSIGIGGSLFGVTIPYGKNVPPTRPRYMKGSIIPELIINPARVFEHHTVPQPTFHLRDAHLAPKKKSLQEAMERKTTHTHNAGYSPIASSNSLITSLSDI